MKCEKDCWKCELEGCPYVLDDFIDQELREEGLTHSQLKRLRYQRAYNTTEKARASKRRYNKTERGKASQSKYIKNHPERRKESVNKYAQSEHGKEKMREYRNSEQGKELKRKWFLEHKDEVNARRRELYRLKKELKQA